MITIDCHELTVDEKLALASEISDELAGVALALIKDGDIVIDQLGRGALDPGAVEAVVTDFVSRRVDASNYSVEREEDFIVVHSPDPIAAKHGRRQNRLPDNVKICPFCSFVTPYEELYVVHVRSHGFT